MDWQEAVRIAQAFLDKGSGGRVLNYPEYVSTDDNVFILSERPERCDDSILIVDIATGQARFVHVPLPGEGPHPFPNAHPVVDPGEADTDDDTPLTIIDGDGNIWTPALAVA